MMKKGIYITGLLALSSISFTSCEEVLNEINTSSSTSNEENIAKGLKEALRVGTDSAVTKLNKPDGYFKDAAIKILLPPELQTAIANFKSKSFTVLGQTFTGETLYNTGVPSLNINPLKSKEEELILGINRATEAAAVEAKPIFVDAITGMSITDASNILFGGVDTAATGYLRKNTYNGLYSSFEPKIDASLKTVKIGNKAVSTLYEDFIADYNAILNTSTDFSTVGSLMSISPIATTDLSAYTTNKGLSGLFVKVADKEAEIRVDPLARVNDLLKDVFGKLDK
jgi:Protein of unknown function (DUF4197)